MINIKKTYKIYANSKMDNVTPPQTERSVLNQ